MRWIAPVLILAAHPAAATCLALDRMLETLHRQFAEAPVFAGAGPMGATVVTAAPDGSTFSVLSVHPDGIACLIGDGDGWSVPPPPRPGKDG